MKIPKKVKVGGIQYKIEIKDKLEDSGSQICGRLTMDKQLIELSKGEQDYMLETLWHELFHAMNGEFQEVIIDYMAKMMFQFVKDNPDFFKN